MSTSSSLLQRCVLVAAVMMMVGSYGIDRAAAEGHPPAQVGLVDGLLAGFLLGLNSGPQALVGEGDAGEVIVLVPGTDLEDARQRLNALKVSDEVEGCGPGEGTCCNAETKQYVIYAEFEKKQFWLTLRENCWGLPPQHGVDEGPPLGEEIAEVVNVPLEIKNALVAEGIKGPFMTFATETGEGRILDDPSYESSQLWLPPAMLDRLWLKKRSPIILTGHVASSDPRCASSVSSCKKDNGDRCSDDRLHWFRYNDSRAKWCQMSDKCTC
jgi:hypothetical protein